MKVTRRGADRYRGTMTLLDKPAQISWDSSERGLQLEVLRAPDPNTASTYNYEVTLTSSELGSILAFLADEVPEESRTALGADLAQHTRSLWRLLNLAAGT